MTAPAVSTDPNYNTRDAADVLVTNTDNDVAGITVTATPTPLATTEAGGTATFTVVLNTQPTANVTIALSSSNPAEGTVVPASLVFTSANWNVAQTVTVTGGGRCGRRRADHVHDCDGAGGEHRRELQHAGRGRRPGDEQRQRRARGSR